jgi:hypothetical protein
VYSTTGSTSGTARMPGGSGWASSQVSAATHDSPLRAWAISVETEFVSMTGLGVVPAAAKGPS